jgi:hypothetical protein
MASTSQPVPPVVCTLTTKAMAEQSLEWADLQMLASTVESLPNGARAVFPAHQAPAIGALVDREADCCGSWLEIAMTPGDDDVMVEMTTSNPEGLALIATMLGTADLT